MTALNPYLNFRGNAREAMEFYRDVFGGELRVATFADYHSSADPSEDGLVMHSELHGPDGVHLMGSDAPKRIKMQVGDNFALSLGGEDEALLRGWFDRLAEGGTVLQPLQASAWGDTFGMLTDRFGVRWLVNIGAPAN